MVNTTGSLSAASGVQTVFTALQVNSVYVNARITDNVTGEVVERLATINVQPPGGVMP